MKKHRAVKAAKKTKRHQTSEGKAPAEGLQLSRLAGRPSKQDFIKVYGLNEPRVTGEERAAAAVPAAKFQGALAKQSGRKLSVASTRARRGNDKSMHSGTRPLRRTFSTALQISMRTYPFLLRENSVKVGTANIKRKQRGGMANSQAQLQRAPRNRTITLSPDDRERLRPRLVPVSLLPASQLPQGITVHGNCLDAAKVMPEKCVDLLFLDPPYNLTKTFNGLKFQRRSVEAYSSWLNDIVLALLRLLKETATIYICGDWHTSASIFEVASEHFIVRNRITWEREKGRGALTNWKNSSEDIWFCTASDQYTFNVDAVKLRRKVLAPYTNGDGSPKDWNRTAEGDYRDTHPSNLWCDITVPFWSMPENTDHPTQKSEKLLARLLLASTNPGYFVLDPFLGSGTTSVVAKKLGRKFLGIEVNEDYCLLAEKRLEWANDDNRIQGFADGVFWERNTAQVQLKTELEDLSSSEIQGKLSYSDESD